MNNRTAFRIRRILFRFASLILESFIIAAFVSAFLLADVLDYLTNSGVSA